MASPSSFVSAWPQGGTVAGLGRNITPLLLAMSSGELGDVRKDGAVPHTSPLATWLWPRQCEGFLLICCAGPELLQQVWLVSPSAMHHPKPHGPGAQPRRAPQTLPFGWQVLARTLNSSCFWMRGRKTALGQGSFCWARSLGCFHVAISAFFSPQSVPSHPAPQRVGAAAGGRRSTPLSLLFWV